MEYLKDSYKWSLSVVAVINIVVFWGVVVSGAELLSTAAMLDSISFKDGIIALIAPIGTFILSGLLSADTKARFIYWRYNNPLPGSRAFSEYLPAETRADPSRLMQQWGEFPGDPAEQNRLWYRIYKSVDEEVRVREAHRASLFSRDLASYGALFLVLFGIATLLSNVPWVVSKWYIMILAIQYLTIVVAARTYGERFVRTVLAIASHMEPHV